MERPLVLYFPIFPGVCPPERILKTLCVAHEALSGHVECMKDAHFQIPAPRGMDEIKKYWDGWVEWKDSDYTTALIALVPSHETRKYTISEASLF
jgi:hypothetical protein